MSNLPRQPENIDPERQALAPYNFVELPDYVARIEPGDLPDQDHFDPGRFTGWINCELTTSSPVFVRCGLSPTDFNRGEEAKEQPDFFFTKDPSVPVIPGSSLRGMLRGVLEVASYSKIEAVTGDQLVYRAVGDTTQHGLEYRKRLMREDDPQKHYYTPLMRGGYIKKDGPEWRIQPAVEIDGVSWARIRQDQKLFDQLKRWGKSKNAREIFVSVGPYQYQPVRGGFIHIKYTRVTRASANAETGMHRAALVISGWMPNKRTEAVIYQEDETAEPVSIPEELVEAYLDQISPEQAELLGPKGVLREDQPVFYLTDPRNARKLVFFGHCMMFRLPYLRSPRDFIPSDLRVEQDLDLAQAIFGYTKKKGKGKEKAFAGRVNISNASLVHGQSDYWLDPNEPLTPKILGSPKPTTFQHYLVQTQPNAFKVGQTRDGRPKFELRLSDYASPTPGGTVIRGHKFYWHKGSVTARDLAETKEVKRGDTQHTRIRPVRAGLRFRFSIHFENLSKIELGALLWVLDLAGDESYRLKLGMGKPLGMGAVAVQSNLQLIAPQDRYSALLDGDRWALGSIEPGNLHNEAITTFEAFVLQAIGRSTAERITELPRIRQMLALLRWPGPDPQKTRYLEIERIEGERKRNEYKGRPVLPSPLGVWGKGMPARAGTVESTPARSTESTSLPPGYKRGVVKSFGLGLNQSFGFIQPEGGGQDIFIHRSQLPPGIDLLHPGQKVIFKVGKGMKGPQAEEVKLDL